MVSVLRGLKKYRLLLAVVSTVFFITYVLYSETVIASHIDGLLKSFGTNFPQGIDFAYQPSINILGYHIAKNDVKFKFINPKNKQGDVKQITKQNLNTYNEVMNQEISLPKDFDIESIRPPQNINEYQHANATISSLVRESELVGLCKTIKLFEARFNHKFQYPYTIMNDQPFLDGFKKAILALTDAPVEFVLIPPELWSKPSWVDEKKEKEGQAYLYNLGIPYARTDSYRSMCRFYSGKFYKVPEMLKYKYYWRIEPNVQFFNDVDYDVFKYLQGTDKIYGFTTSLYDIEQTIETLWPETLQFLELNDNYKHINQNGSFQWLLDDLQKPKKAQVAGGYSTCHFWSNFEIADMDFWRSDAYDNWFEYLDSTGKFYYERWGDAPVHSIGLGLFADKSRIHWFRDVGYYHPPYIHCPNVKDQKSRCKVGQFTRSWGLSGENCMANWIDYGIDDLSTIY